MTLGHSRTALSLICDILSITPYYYQVKYNIIIFLSFMLTYRPDIARDFRTAEGPVAPGPSPVLAGGLPGVAPAEGPLLLVGV
jgi:hypothetical protein